METIERANLAAALRGKYNCAQAVLLSYKDILNLNEETMVQIASGFAVGMGNMKNQCGAVSAAIIVAGIISSGNRTPILAKQIQEEFYKLSGANICEDLKGVKTGIVICSCPDCCKNAVIALDKVLENNNLKNY